MTKGLTLAQHQEQILAWVRDNPGQQGPDIALAFGYPRGRLTLKLLGLFEAGLLARIEISSKKMHYFCSAEEAELARGQLEADSAAASRAKRVAASEKYEANRVRKPKPKARNIVSKYAALDKALLKLCGSQDGLRVAPMLGCSSDKIGSRVLGLVNSGRVFRGKANHNLVRYFLSQAAADAWLAAYKSTAPMVNLKAARARHVGPCIVPAHVKVQRIPHQPGRFEVSLPRGHGQISADWLLGRQGVDVRAVVALT